MGEYEGTITSKLKPIVTTLTEALVHDFELVYKPEPVVGHVLGKRLWVRTDETGEEAVVDDAQLRRDVTAWLMALEQDMTEDSDKKYAQMVMHMISKNPGWVDLLTKRLIKRLS